MSVSLFDFFWIPTLIRKHVGLKSRYMTLSKVCGTTKVRRRNIYKTAWENAKRKSNHRIWVLSSLVEWPVILVLAVFNWNCIDKKATALLKVIYLEMFGYDMSWASFHVLEVMSSTNHLQKRVGYLGAMQSFRSDTEVLMLATNLLKKVCAYFPWYTWNYVWQFHRT